MCYIDFPGGKKKLHFKASVTFDRKGGKCDS